MKKIIVAHPFRQHSFQLASALNQEGNLFAYCTTVYDKKKSFMGIVKKLIKGDLLKKANGRKCKGINDSQIYLFCEFRGYLALILNRYCKNTDIKRAYQRYLYKCFGKQVAKFAVKNDVDAVIIFDTTATSCFSYIKKNSKKIKCILDMAAITRPYAKSIYEIEDKRLNKNYFKETQRYLWNKVVMSYMNRELALADKFLAASSFTADSIEYCNRAREDVEIIPYGIDSNGFSVGVKSEDSDVLKLIFVGHVDYQKGVHYLLRAVEEFEETRIDLDLYGVYNTTSQLYKIGKKMKNVHFKGFVTPDKLNDVYSSADVFIFPSTNDGYGFVVLEAMACGCPVLCSKNVGACDLVEDGVNGFLFESGDVNKMVELLQWCIDNKERLQQMGEKSREKVEQVTWEKYNKRINNFIDEL